VLADRRRNEKHRLSADAVARKRDKENERYLQQKINAGYVMLVAVYL
jgi:hypothetical protein